jgi:S1-C subfamily serine protease
VRKIVTQLALVALALTACAAQGKRSAEPRSVSDAIELVRPSVVQIQIIVRPVLATPERPAVEPGEAPLGTGFLVSVDGYVITARHVITAGQTLIAQLGSSSSLNVGIPLPNLDNVRGVTLRGSFTPVSFDEVDEDAAHDLALLKLARNPLKGEVSPSIIAMGVRIAEPHVALATIDAARPKDGAPIAISGYPLNEPGLVTNAGWLASGWAFTTHEVPAHPPLPASWMIPEVADSYLADVTANPGNSGGPVYLVETGGVIGVCVSGKQAPVKDQNDATVAVNGHQLLYAAGLTVVVPAEYVIKLLEKNGVKWQTSAKSR